MLVNIEKVEAIIQ